jgi:UPF0176 protein
MTVIVAAFYKFVAIDDCADLQQRLLVSCRSAGVLGTILLAREGINATISAAPDAMAAFLAELRCDPRFADLTAKQAQADRHPFQRLKVKVKPEIIASIRATPAPSEPSAPTSSRTTGTR